MTIGLIGRKVGMTRVFSDDGDSLPVTVLDLSGNRIVQIKTSENDGYSSVQLAFGTRRANRVRKPLAGHLAKAGVEAGTSLVEFRADTGEVASLKPGGQLRAGDVYKVGQLVDVSGYTKGKGFAGVIRRHQFASNRASHGNSRSTKKPGSTGQAQDPGRIFPGKRMPGHLGDVRRTTQNLEIVRVDVERDLLLIKGAVPGSAGRDVVVRPAVKG